DTTTKLVANQTDVTWKLNTGNVEHTLVTGLAFTRETYDLINGNSQRTADGSNPGFPGMDIANPDNYYTGPVNFIRSGQTEGEVSNVALYAFDDIKVNEQWSFNGGIRFEHNKGESTATTYALPSAGGAATVGQ